MPAGQARQAACNLGCQSRQTLRVSPPPASRGGDSKLRHDNSYRTPAVASLPGGQERAADSHESHESYDDSSALSDRTIAVDRMAGRRRPSEIPAATAGATLSTYCCHLDTSLPKSLCDDSLSDAIARTCSAGSRSFRASAQERRLPADRSAPCPATRAAARRTSMLVSPARACESISVAESASPPGVRFRAESLRRGHACPRLGRRRREQRDRSLSCRRRDTDAAVCVGMPPSVRIISCRTSGSCSV